MNHQTCFTGQLCAVNSPISIPGQPTNTRTLHTVQTDLLPGRRSCAPVVYSLLLMVLLLGSIRLAAQQELTGIRVGGKVPDVTLTGIRNYASPTARISDFKGKLLILDFWASWCSPCLAMIPRMDSLQRAHHQQVQFLAVNYETEAKAAPLAARVRKQAPSPVIEIYGDKVLGQLFPHKELPHYVWINGTGTVIAITGEREVNDANIRKVLASQTADLTEKKDVYTPYDKSKPLLVGNNGGNGKNMLYHSMITGFIQGLSSGQIIGPFANDSLTSRISVRNESPLQLFELAYSNGNRNFRARKILEVRDSARFLHSETDIPLAEWQKSNQYCYELVVPKRLAPQRYALMQRELDLFFPEYNVRVEKRKILCLALVRTSAEDKLKTTGGTGIVEVNPFGCNLVNTYLNHLVIRLDATYLQKSPYPVVNDTGYSGKVDLKLEANLGNVEAINRALEKYDLALVKRELETDVLIVSDRN